MRFIIFRKSRAWRGGVRIGVSTCVRHSWGLWARLSVTGRFGLRHIRFFLSAIEYSTGAFRFLWFLFSSFAYTPFRKACGRDLLTRFFFFLNLINKHAIYLNVLVHSLGRSTSFFSNIVFMGKENRSFYIRLNFPT